MARWEFKLPDVGEGVAEGEIVGWLVKPGDVVSEDQPIVEVMTDKATVTITAPKAGVGVETRGRVGEIVPVHAVLVVFELDGAPAVPPPLHTNGTKAARDRGRRPCGHGRRRASRDAPRDGRSGVLQREAARDPRDAKAGPRDGRRLAARAPERTGRARHASGRGRGSVRSPETDRSARSGHGDEPPGIPRGSTPGANSATSALSAGREERVPMVGMRRRIAQKMAQSKSTAAHYTFVEECDATELKRLRTSLKSVAEAQGVKLSFLPFVVKAVVAALKKHPTLNTTLDEARNEIVFRKYFHIGIATATDAGLVVPVVKDADKKSILEIAREIERLADEARAGKARAEDLSGSTFTVTSLGSPEGRGLFATPIINFPEVAILGVHQMKTKPVVRDGQIVIGDVMLLSLSFDHRIVDGHVGAAFALEVIAYLERPEALLLELA